MNPVIIIEISMVLFLVWVLVSQIVIPLKNGRPMFPMFGRMPKLQDDLARARQDADERRMEKQIEKVKSKSTTTEES